MKERYFPVPGLSREFYERLDAERPHFELLDTFTIPEKSGRGFYVNRGCTARFVTVEGAQIADVDIFNRHDPSERLWANQTMNREGAWLTKFNRLWSNMPRFRPLMTIIEDTVETRDGAGEFHHHHIVGAHCNPYFWLVATGKRDLPSCYGNLVDAIRPFGLGPEHVHDNLNLFQKTAKDVRGAHNTVESDARPGDFVEFYAEIDVLVAVSLCPQGSGRTLPTDPFQDTHSMRIEIHDTGVEPLEFSYDSFVKEMGDRTFDG